MAKLTAKQYLKAAPSDMSETDKADLDAVMYGTGVVMIQSDGSRKHIPLKDVVLTKAPQTNQHG